MVFQLQMVTDAGVGHAVAAYRVGVIDSVFRCCMFIFSMLNYWECSTCRLIRFISHALSSGNFTLHAYMNLCMIMLGSSSHFYIGHVALAMSTEATR